MYLIVVVLLGLVVWVVSYGPFDAHATRASERVNSLGELACLGLLETEAGHAEDDVLN